MIRILHIVSYMQRGGLETFLMNCYRHIDREQMQFDFIVHRSFRADYDDEIESLGGKIYRLPRLNPFNPGYKKALLDFFHSHPEYRIVHCHLDCMSALPLAAAKQCGVPVRIAHSHNSNQDRDWKYPLKRFYMKRIPGVATHFFACSQAAGAWMFPGQPVQVVNNGIDAEKFGYSPKFREEVRRELNLADNLVLGHIGRFVPQKNHAFLLDVFRQVHRRNPNTRLLLVGEGPMEAQIREKAAKLGLAEAVIFLGVRSDVERLLQGMDVFVLPSLYEGLGIVAVEAQASGLQCVLSDQVPSECKMTDNITFLPLEESPECWAETILSLDTTARTSQSEKIRSAGFDIQTTAQWLTDFYASEMSFDVV